MSSKKRILDRTSYEDKTLFVYGIVGAYVVDLYYNYLYMEAVKMRNSKKVPSVTEGYKHSVFAFLSAINNKLPPKKAVEPTESDWGYSQLLKGIHRYFNVWASFTTLTMNDCIDRIVKEFVPDDFFSSLDKEQKRAILRLILTNSIREFSKVVITEYLSHLIDNHEDEANIEALKDKMIDLLIMEREALFYKFIKSAAGSSTEVVDKNLAVQMQQEIKSLIRERDTLQKRLKDAEGALEVRTKQVKQLLDKYKEMVRKNKSLTEEFTEVKDRLYEKPKLVDFGGFTNFDDEDDEQMNSIIQRTQQQSTQMATQQSMIHDQSPKSTSQYNNQPQQSVPSIKGGASSQQSTQQLAKNNATLPKKQPIKSSQLQQAEQFIPVSSQSNTDPAPLPKKRKSKQTQLQTQQEPKSQSVTQPEVKSQLQIKSAQSESQVIQSEHELAQSEPEPNVDSSVPPVEDMDNLLSKHTADEAQIVENRFKNATQSLLKTDMGDEPSIGDIY